MIGIDHSNDRDRPQGVRLYYYVEEYFHVSKYVDGYLYVVEPTLGSHSLSIVLGFKHTKS